MHPAIDELRRAFDDGEFVLYYQPILRLDDGQMSAAEALLRWRHPSDGLVPTAQFLPVLEASGLIVEIGCWAVREAARQLHSWRMLYGRDIVEWLGVNLSPQQLAAPDPLLRTLYALSESGLLVHRLKLEIAEAALLRHAPQVRALIPELEPLGVQIAVEEFAGACMPLLRGAVDAIKIDAGLVRRLETAPGVGLAETLRDLADAGSTAIIAKGIERGEQTRPLRSAGCGYGQGYLFADPMDGALLGAYALTRAVAPGGAARRRAGDMSGLNRPTSAGRSRAG